MTKCERSFIFNGKVNYCQNEAHFESPPGVHTGRTILVCSMHKRDIENYNNTKGIKNVFKTI